MPLNMGRWLPRMARKPSSLPSLAVALGCSLIQPVITPKCAASPCVPHEMKI